jgi:type VI secretion system protein ImpI
MPLTLQLVNEATLPDGGPVSIQISGKRGIDIGRATHLDWTLPDSTRYISSKHCEIRYKDGGYWLHDVSTNGTFVNGASNRIHEPHRLQHGDRFLVGQYIVAVTVDGEEDRGDAPRQQAAPIAPAPIQGPADQGWWANEGDVPPPIDAKQLKPARAHAAVNPDFLDWAADVPAPLLESPRPHVPSPPTKPISGPLRSDMDWADGPPSHIPEPSPAPPPAPAPRRPGPLGAEPQPPVLFEAQGDAVVDLAPPPRPQAVPPPEPTPRPASLVGNGAAAATFIAQLAKAANVPEDLFTQKDPAALATEIGTVLRVLVENLMQLLNARQQAKRLAHSSQHTMVQALDNNPLKFSPSSHDALRIMFGPSHSGYLDAKRAIDQGFADLKSHQIKTYAAMQHALSMIMGDLDPKKIAEQNEGKGGVGLRQLRKARLWDVYEARWDAKVGRKGGEPVEAFMRYFAESYDREGG